MSAAIFHLAFPVTDIPSTKRFYAEGLGCAIGRESPSAVIMNLSGHQLVAHVTRQPPEPQGSIYPRHFGLVFADFPEWEALRDRAIAQDLQFYQAPKLRFPNLITEHHTFFLADPFHNLLEFKVYVHTEAIFGAVDLGAVGDRES